MPDKKWIWISGWGICPNRFKAAAEQALPHYIHHVLAPTPDAFETALNGNAGSIGGYSLGSLILLSELSRIPETAEVICLAPFISFCKEQQLGGKTTAATLGRLQQRLKTQPDKTLRLFYRLADLNDEPVDGLPYELEHLEWGLKQLACLKANIALLHRAKGFVGSVDPLINHTVLQSKWKNCRIISKNCGHNYYNLLIALKNLFS